MQDNKTNQKRDHSAGLKLEEEFLSGQQVRDKQQPFSCSTQALEEPLPVAPLANLPAEWEVETSRKWPHTQRWGSTLKVSREKYYPQVCFHCENTQSIPNKPEF